MGGRVMVSVVKGMSGSLAGNHATHDQETGQDSENECCAGYTSHECITLKFSIGQGYAGCQEFGTLSHVGEQGEGVLRVLEAALPAYREER